MRRPSDVRRRDVLQIGGGLLLAGSPVSGRAASAEGVEIAMRGNADGSKVWFDPIGIHVEPGQIIRWTNCDPGNSHTTTAYHPRNADHPRRIPQAAEPWDSDYLLPDQTFTLRLTIEGVFDYFCLPHEMAGMVGRIVVGRPCLETQCERADDLGGAIPEEALLAFPRVEEVLRRGAVHLDMR